MSRSSPERHERHRRPGFVDDREQQLATRDGSEPEPFVVGRTDFREEDGEFGSLTSGVLDYARDDGRRVTAAAPGSRRVYRTYADCRNLPPLHTHAQVVTLRTRQHRSCFVDERVSAQTAGTPGGPQLGEVVLQVCLFTQAIGPDPVRFRQDLVEDRSICDNQPHPCHISRPLTPNRQGGSN